MWGEVLEFGVHLVCWSGPVQKRFRLNRKTPAHFVGISAHSRPRVWKRLRQVGFSGLSMPDRARRRCDHADGALFMSMTEWVWGNFAGFCAGPRLQVCTPFN